MNKILFSVSLFFLFATSVSAQVNWNDYSLGSSHVGYTPVNSPYLSIAMPVNESYLIGTSMRSPLYESLLLSNSFTSSRSIQIQYYKMYDSSDVYIFLSDAYIRSLDDYEFRVLENGTSTIVPWSKPETIMN